MLDLTNMRCIILRILQVIIPVILVLVLSPILLLAYILTGVFLIEYLLDGASNWIEKIGDEIDRIHKIRIE